MDWFEWHAQYRRSPELRARLELVRQSISQVLLARPPGPIQVVSICAGDGRDLLGALLDHSRTADVKARLVEADPRLVSSGRQAVRAADLDSQIEFAQADATDLVSYEGAIPAALVLLCGVIGNVSVGQLPSLCQGLTSLCLPGGSLIWTLGLGTEETAPVELVTEHLQAAGFTMAAYHTTPRGRFGVGVAQFSGPTTPSRSTWFEFAGQPRQFTC